MDLGLRKMLDDAGLKHVGVTQYILLELAEVLKSSEDVPGAGSAWQALSDFIMSSSELVLPAGAYAPIVFILQFLHAVVSGSDQDLVKETDLISVISLWVAEQSNVKLEEEPNAEDGSE